MRRGSLALSLALAWWLPVAEPGAAAPRQREPRLVPAAERLDAWLDAVRTHEPGTIDQAALDIASWPDQHLMSIVDEVAELSRFLVRAHVRLKRTGQQSGPAHLRGRTLSVTEVQRLFGLTDEEAARGDVCRLALRGALLHTDITVAVDEYDPLLLARRPSTPRWVIRISDGRHEGLAERGPHWEAARLLLGLIPPDSETLPRRREWYVAAAAFMYSRGRLADLLPHVDHGLRLLPDDAELLFYSGAMHETFASPSIQNALRGLAAPSTTAPVVAAAGTHLERAASFFRRALDRDPRHAEARVRLGRVLDQRGQREEAERELRQALETGSDAYVKYLAALFVGGIEMRTGRDDDARRSFERALGLFPRAQSPRIALSSLARKAGRRRDATAGLLEGLPARHLDDRRDPWWSYFNARGDRADSLLDAWRKALEPWSGR